MIDFTSVASVLNSDLPHDESVESWLSLNIRLEEELAPASALLAHQGYLGCLSLAHWRKEDIVIRLLPNKRLDTCPVAAVHATSAEGKTIASRIGQLVPAHIARNNCGVVGTRLEKNVEARLLEFSRFFNEDSSGLQDVLLEANVLRQQSTSEKVKNGTMWLAIDPADELYQTFAELSHKEEQALGSWVSMIVEHTSFPLDMILRRYITYHILFRTGVAVTEAVWQLILRDMVFDVSFSIMTSGWFGSGGWRKGALRRGVNWLVKQDPINIPISPILWEGAKQFAAAPKKYNGALHLKFAREIASENPTLAYTHACNAACQWVRATQKTPIDATVFAHELAVANDWGDLATILGWSRDLFGR